MVVVGTLVAATVVSGAGVSANTGAATSSRQAITIAGRPNFAGTAQSVGESHRPVG
jgi:hypothetical protein